MQLAWDNVNDIFKLMQPRLADAGITVRMPEGDINQIAIDKYNEVFDFIHILSLSDEWARLKKFHDSVGEWRWQGFRDLGQKNAAEHRELRRHLAPFKALWKPPSGFFNRKIKFQNVTDTPDS
jgi:hypothetical protein